MPAAAPSLRAESPMVLLSGHAATWELGRGGFQELRQADMAAPVTKATASGSRLGTWFAGRWFAGVMGDNLAVDNLI